MTLERWMRRTRTLQADLARSAGISQSAVSLLLAGKRTPTLAVARAIEKATDGKVPVEAWAKKTA